MSAGLKQREFDYSDLLGRRIIIAAGENIELAARLPTSGRVLGQAALADWGSDWLHLRLDDPITYASRSYSECLVRSRELKRPIDSAGVSVFLLFEREAKLSEPPPWSSGDFYIADWATAKVAVDG